MLAHGRDGTLGVEALQQHGGRARPRDLEQAGAEAVDVEERQRQQHAVARGHRGGPQGGALADVGDEGAVGEHRAARHPGRAGGVTEHGEVLVAADRGELRLVGGGQGGRAHRGYVGATGVADEQAGAAVGDQAFELPQRLAGPGGHDDTARAQDAEDGDAELRPGGQPHDDPVTRGDPGVDQHAGLRAHRGVDLPPGELRPARRVDQRDVLRTAQRGGADQVGDVAGRLGQGDLLMNTPGPRSSLSRVARVM